MENCFETISFELIKEIAYWLDDPSILCLSMVCKSFSHLTTRNYCSDNFVELALEHLYINMAKWGYDLGCPFSVHVDKSQFFPFKLRLNNDIPIHL